MAAHTHNVWLIVRRKILDRVRKQGAKFLTLGPVRTVFMKKFEHAVLISEGKGVSSLILPTKIHRRRRKVSIPRPPDVLTGDVQQVRHCKSVKVIRVNQDVVGEQSTFFSSARRRQHITCC